MDWSVESDTIPCKRLTLPRADDDDIPCEARRDPMQAETLPSAILRNFIPE